MVDIVTYLVFRPQHLGPLRPHREAPWLLPLDDGGSLLVPQNILLLRLLQLRLLLHRSAPAPSLLRTGRLQAR